MDRDLRSHRKCQSDGSIPAVIPVKNFSGRKSGEMKGRNSKGRRSVAGENLRLMNNSAAMGNLSDADPMNQCDQNLFSSALLSDQQIDLSQENSATTTTASQIPNDINNAEQLTSNSSSAQLSLHSGKARQVLKSFLQAGNSRIVAAATGTNEDNVQPIQVSPDNVSAISDAHRSGDQVDDADDNVQNVHRTGVQMDGAGDNVQVGNDANNLQSTRCKRSQVWSAGRSHGQMAGAGAHTQLQNGAHAHPRSHLNEDLPGGQLRNSGPISSQAPSIHVPDDTANYTGAQFQAEMAGAGAHTQLENGLHAHPRPHLNQVLPGGQLRNSGPTSSQAPRIHVPDDTASYTGAQFQAEVAGAGAHTQFEDGAHAHSRSHLNQLLPGGQLRNSGPTSSQATRIHVSDDTANYTGVQFQAVMAGAGAHTQLENNAHAYPRFHLNQPMPGGQLRNSGPTSLQAPRIHVPDDTANYTGAQFQAALQPTLPSYLWQNSEPLMGPNPTANNFQEQMQLPMYNQNFHPLSSISSSSTTLGQPRFLQVMPASQQQVNANQQSIATPAKPTPAEEEKLPGKENRSDNRGKKFGGRFYYKKNFRGRRRFPNGQYNFAVPYGGVPMVPYGPYGPPPMYSPAWMSPPLPSAPPFSYQPALPYAQSNGYNSYFNPFCNFR